MVSYDKRSVEQYSLCSLKGRRQPGNDSSSIPVCCIFFTSSLFAVLSSCQVDIFQKDLLLIPIHLEVHWSLVCVDIPRRAITYFDSQRTLNRRCPKVGLDSHTKLKLVNYLKQILKPSETLSEQTVSTGEPQVNFVPGQQAEGPEKVESLLTANH